MASYHEVNRNVSGVSLFSGNARGYACFHEKTTSLALMAQLGAPCFVMKWCQFRPVSGSVTSDSFQLPQS